MTGSVVFIDSRVPDLRVLLDGLAPGAAAHVLAPSRDGIGQVAEILAAEGVRDLATLVLVGHGRPGAIELGSGAIDADGLSDHSPDLARIGAALAPGADVLLYACDVADGAAGRRFIATLAGAFGDGVEVAAASHPVGSPHLGASWTLDATTGSVGSPIPFTPAAQASYAGLLAVRYSLSGSYNFGNTSNSSYLVLGDFNNDGIIDQIYDTDGNQADGKGIALALGYGDGTFQTAIPKPDDGASYDGTHPFTSGPLAGIDLPGTSIANLFAVDINNDGFTDLISAPANGVPKVYLNSASGFNTTAATPFPAQMTAGRFVFGDFNGDGFLDVINQVTTNTSGANITLYLGSANGSFTAIPKPDASAFTSGPLNGINFTFISNAVFAVDLNGDGTDDIVDSANSGGVPNVYLSSGSSLTATAVNPFPAQAAGFTGRFVFGDFDSDGDIDALNQTSGNNPGQGITLYLNSGSGSFTSIAKTDDATAGDGLSPFTSGPFSGLDFRLVGATFFRNADVDHDGDLDLVDTNNSNHRYLVQGSSSGGNGSPPALASSTPADNATGVAPSANIVLTFDESVSKGTGNIEIVRISDDTVIQTIAVTSGAVTGSGTTWTINPPSDLAGGVKYGVRIASGTFVDGDGAIYFGNAAAAISFTTQANTPPTLNHDTGLTLLEGGTATITATQLDFDDAEQADTAITYTVTTAATNGTLFRSGAAVGLGGSFTQDDIDNNRVTYTHDGSETTSASFGFSVSDGAGGSVTGQSFAFTVTAVDDAPTLSPSNTNPTFTEGGAAAILSSGLTLTDPDTATFTGATVVLNDPVTGDLLSGGTSGPFTGSYSAGTHTLTLTGSGTAVELQAALRTVAFSSTSDDPTVGGTDNMRGLSITAFNGGTNGTSNSATAIVSVAAVNDAPVATITQASYSATEQTALSLRNTGLSLSDVDGGTGTETATLSVSEGTLTVSAGSSGASVANSGTSSVTITGTLAQINALLNTDASSAVSYIDNTDTPSASAILTLGINDGGNTGTGGAQSGSASTTISIAAVNDAPVATITQASYSATEQTALSLRNTGLSLSDVDGGTGTETATLSVSEGTLTVSAGSSGASVANSGTSSVTITGTLAQINALLNTDASSAVSYIDNTDTPSASAILTLGINDGGNTGTGVAQSGSASATINIAAVNDPPSLTGTLSATVLEGGSHILAATELGFTDPDDVAAGETFSVSNLVAGTIQVGGVTRTSFTATELANNQVAFVHDGSEGAAASFSVSVEDGNEDVSAPVPQTFSLTVTPVNDAPVLATNAAAALAYTENAAATAIVPGLTLGDVDSANLTGASVAITAGYVSGQDVLAFANANGITGSYAAATGVLTLSGSATLAQYQAALRTVTYANTSDDPATAARTVSITATDGTDSSLAVTRSIAVTAVNDAPTLTGTLTATVLEGGSHILAATELGFSDPDDVASGETFTVSSLVAGTIQVGGVTQTSFTGTQLANNQVAFVHDGSEGAAASFSVSVEDGNEDTSAPSPSTFNLTVTPVNDPPTLTGTLSATVLEGGSHTLAAGELGFSDPDDVAAGETFSVSNLVAGTIQVGGVTQTSFTATELANNLVAFVHDGSEGATASFSVSVEDGNADNSTPTPSIFNLTVTPVNDPPVLATNAAGALAYTENAATAIVPGLTLSDPDSTNLTGATVAITAGYVSGQDVLAFANGNGITGTYDAATGVLSLSGSATLAQYEAALRGVTYANTSDDPATAARTVSFTATDGTDSSLAVTRSIAVTAVNDAPALTGTLSATVLEGGSHTLAAAELGFSDPDDVAAGETFTISTLVAGVIQVGSTTQTSFTGTQLAGGLVSFVHDGSEGTAASFSVSVEDGNEDVSTPVAQTFTLAVTPVNDAPVNTVPASIAIANSGHGAITGLSIADPDAGGATLTTTLAVGNGTLTVAPGAAAVTGSGSALVTLTGTLASINATLAASGGVTYQNAPGTTDLLTVTTDDGGNSGLGGALTDIDTVTITVASLPPPPPSPTDPTPGDDNLTGTDGPDSTSLLAGNDTYAGGPGNDTVLGNEGDDLVQGNQGDDLLYGNQGNDTIYGGQGADTLFGGQNRDLLYGDLGDDVVLGNLGADTLLGNMGNDTLFGGQGNDLIYGGQGDDVLFGDLGDDVLSGDLGADRYVFGQNSGHDVILGFAQGSGDRIDLQGQSFTFGIAADGSGSALLVLSGGGTIELAGITQAQVNAGFFAT